ncbi:NAD(P)/FAD-dependent oxidoreductase [Cupriavidus basilensis]
MIVGAGLAGVSAAEGLRQVGYVGRILLVGDEPERPYDRPPLSKSVLLDPAEAKRIDLRDATFYKERDIELRLGDAVTRIDRPGQRAQFADGSTEHFDKLLIATGSSLRLLPELPPQTPNVYYLRRLIDALALRDALPNIKRLLVVGAGVIGLEVAAVAKVMGIDVTVIEAGARPMVRATCPMLCEFIVAQHRIRGVNIQTQVTITDVSSASAGYRILLSNGETIIADAIVVGVGVVPNAGLAEEAGLPVVDGGVAVDGHGRTKDPNIYAAGEVACHFNARLARLDRQENWHHAAAHGMHVGRSVISPTEDYDEICGYWSDQYDFSVQSFGVSVGDTDVLRGDPASGSFTIFHLVDRVVRGVSSINAPREMRIGKALVLYWR